MPETILKTLLDNTSRFWDRSFSGCLNSGRRKPVSEERTMVKDSVVWTCKASIFMQDLFIDIIDGQPTNMMPFRWIDALLVVPVSIRVVDADGHHDSYVISIVDTSAECVLEYDDGTPDETMTIQHMLECLRISHWKLASLLDSEHIRCESQHRFIYG